MKSRWVWSVVLALGAASCADSVECGAGTRLVNGACTPTATTTVTCGANTALMNGMCVAMPSGTTCGTGTVLMSGMCVAMPVTATTCGTGTVLMNGMCVVAPAAPSPLASVAVAGMSFDGDPTVALEPGHRLPITLSLQGTARMGAAAGSTAPVQVAVALVPVATDPGMRRRCVVNGEIALVPTDGRPLTVAPEMVIPTTCLAAGVTSGRFNVEVTLTQGANTDPLAAPAGTQTVLSFTSDRVSNASLPESQCRVIDGAADARCGLEFGIQRPATPSTSLSYGVELESSVGTLWPRTPPADLAMGTTEAKRPNLVLSLNSRAYGNDPNSQMDDTLPGPVRVTVDLSPEEGSDVGQWEPLSFRRHLDGSDMLQTSLTYTALDSAATDQNSLYVYLPDALQDRILTGTWQNTGIYRLRVCQTPMGWTSPRTRTDEDPSLVNGTSIDDANCRSRRVRFARSTGATLTSARVSSWDLDRTVGGRQMGGTLHLGATGTIGSETVSSVADGYVDLKFFGANISLINAAARATGVLAAPATSSVGYSLSVFGLRIFNVSNPLGTAPERSVSRMTSLMREQCVSKTFVLGVVPFLVSGCLRGTLGVTGEVAVGGGTTAVPTELMGSPQHVYSRLGVTPSVDVGLGLSGGLGTEAISAGVYADVSIADFSVPVTSTQRLGAASSQAPVRGLGNISVNLGLTFLKGAFGIYAEFPVLGRLALEIARWDGIPGFGSRGSMINVLSRNTPVFTF